MPKETKRTKGTQNGFNLREIPDDQAESPAAAPVREAVQPASFEDLGNLPHGYGGDTIFLVAQEPHWLFTYWDIDISKHPGGPTFLRYCAADGAKEGEVEVPFETRNWYIPVHNAGSQYYVEIGYYRGGTWNTIAKSATVETPPEKLSESESFDFATLPFHLGFHRLIENIQSAMRLGEDLVHAISRMQKSGDFSAFGGPSLPALSPDQRKMLESLLGPDLLEQISSGGLSSEEIELRIRTYLEERLSSEGASELIEKARAILPSSSLFSGGAFAGGVSSETTSWNTAAFASWAAAAVSSWVSAASSSESALSSWGQGETSSWSGGASSSWTAAASSSWAAAASSSWASSAGASWGGAASSSWSQAETSSWGLASLSSWLQAVQSSWAQAVLSSWNLASLSSWSSGIASSWGGSESVSSFSSFSLAREREFFMHVNAEVIFYGGTDPKAKLTIDGKEVQLFPDGSFRYHFVFPNAEYEIPIVATSPDGVETRKAVLKFTRATVKEGVVTDTSQPPLGAPMGRIDG